MGYNVIINYRIVLWYFIIIDKLCVNNLIVVTSLHFDRSIICIYFVYIILYKTIEFVAFIIQRRYVIAKKVSVN